MRLLAIAGLGVYGTLNVLVGLIDWFRDRQLGARVDALLVLAGCALVGATALVVARSGHARLLAVVALAAAFIVAVYNERVLGFGHPTHHVIRLAYTAIVLWAVVKVTGAEREPSEAA